MALKGLDIFKLTPKKNCKECGSPTCMAFAMKVAQGAVPITKCPHMGQDVIDQLSEATAPPMKTIEVGTGDSAHKLGGETVLFRHEKTFVSKNLFAATVCSCMDEAEIDAVLANIKKVDYDRIGERMYSEMLYVNYAEAKGADAYLNLVKKVAGLEQVLILGVKDPEVAKAAVELCKEKKPILNGADASNYEAMCNIAKEAGVVLGVSGKDLSEIHDTVAAIEKLGNKNLVIDVTAATVKETFANAVQLRRSAITDGDRTCGYPSIVNVAKLAGGNTHLQTAYAAMFVLKYGSIIVLDQLTYAQALPLCGLRQNIFTDPQKPMRVSPGIYPMNGADENSPCAITVDFALTYFVVSGELERSGVPVNFLITDAGGYSVLTAWAAGKLSAGSIAKFITEEVQDKVKSRKLILPGKVAVLKGELEAKLPDWEIIVGTTEAIELVNYMRNNFK
ncbi:MAG: acetyl-CoA decarbonylase/synthase complex subunit gamma [Firmicutes bacterium]|nr:acetyl-CoA decarbonylase/synthase complex subunit gamma [Bacillota bacterium]